MLKKIILPVVLLIFTQQNFYLAHFEHPLSMFFENVEPISNEERKIKDEIFRNCFQYVKISRYINHNYHCSTSAPIFWGAWASYGSKYIDHKYNCPGAAPLLWPLWAFIDNVLFQYGGSKKIWKHGMVYYGLSNGICFFLNFKWFKIGIMDVHINVITFILNYIRISVAGKTLYYTKAVNKIRNLVRVTDLYPLTEYRGYFYRDICFSLIMTGIHLLSFNFLNCIKIKIISLGGCLSFYYGLENYIAGNQNDRWYFKFYIDDLEELVRFENTNGLYLLLAPRIEINIPGIINYLSGSNK